GRRIRGSDIKDISWFRSSGDEMSDEDWDAGFVRCLGVRLAGDVIGDVDDRGEPIVGDTLLLLLNAHHEAIPFRLPATKPEHFWERLFDTSEAAPPPLAVEGGQEYPLQGRSLALWRTRMGAEPQPVASPAQVEMLRHEVERRERPGRGPAARGGGGGGRRLAPPRGGGAGAPHPPHGAVCCLLLRWGRA